MSQSMQTVTLRYVGLFNYLALHINHCITKCFTEPVVYLTGIMKLCLSLALFDRLCFRYTVAVGSAADSGFTK